MYKKYVVTVVNDMNKYNCKSCGLEHKLITLIEFPKPSVISEITSGFKDGEIEMLSKDMILVNNNTIYFEAELIIPITDFEDELELLTWCVVGKNEIQKYIPFAEETKELNLKVKLDGQIPFYMESDELEMQVRIDLFSRDKPKIKKIFGNYQLINDFENGISLNSLREYLSKFYHYNE